MPVSVCIFFTLLIHGFHTNKTASFSHTCHSSHLCETPPWLYTARLDHQDGDNNTANPKHIEELVSYASSSDGLSPQDFAAYRVYRERPYPHSELPGFVGTRLRCGEVGLIIGALGRGDFEVLGVRPILFFLALWCYGESKIVLMLNVCFSEIPSTFPSTASH